MDAATVAAEVVPYVTAAASAYGVGVLTRAQDAAAEATVGLGHRVLARILHREASRPAIESAVTDLAHDPTDEDFQATLRAQIKKALREDPELTRELTAMLNAAGPTINASGTRSIATQTNSGIANTGDNATIQR